MALAALAAGLVAGSLGRPAVAAASAAVAAIVSALAGTGGARAAATVLAALAGFSIGAAREQALAPVPPPAYVKAGKATVVEAARAERFGWRAVVEAGGRRLLVRGRGAAPAVAVGDLVRAAGPVDPVGPRDGWLRAKRVSGVASVGEIVVVGRRGGPAGVVDAVRRRALSALGGRRETPEGSLLQGMVLGDDTAMSPGLRDRMRRTGLGHLVAASGANVALLVGLVLSACAITGMGRIPRLSVASAAVVSYALLCGPGPSIVRATVMGLASLAAAIASRPASKLQAVLLAATVSLAIDPGAWRDVGWQLSFAAVAGLAAFGGQLQRRLRTAGLPGPLAEAGAMTLAATVATAPVAAAAFGRFSPASLPANLLAGPLVAPATWLGMVGALLAQVDERLARPPVGLAGLPSSLIVAIAGRLSVLPYAQVEAGPLAVSLGALAAAGALVAVVGPRFRRPALAGAALALGLLVAIVAAGSRRGPGAPPAGVDRVTFMDVGQGDATLVQSGGRSLLVDAGPDAGPVVERLREAGVERLDALLVTHAQADHLGGADAVIEEVGVGTLIDGRDGVLEPQGREMALAARRKGVPMVVPRAGESFRVGSLTARVLSPEGPGTPGTDPNLRCVVLRVDGPGLSLLLGADAESEVLGPLHPGPVRLLKVSHHGSRDPGLTALLAELRPQLAVIEVGAGNPYGHPAPATLSALRGTGVPVMRTDRDGSVRVDVAAGSMRVQHGS